MTELNEIENNRSYIALYKSIRSPKEVKKHRGRFQILEKKSKISTTTL